MKHALRYSLGLLAVIVVVGFCQTAAFGICLGSQTNLPQGPGVFSEPVVDGILTPRPESPEAGISDDTKRQLGKTFHNELQAVIAAGTPWIEETGRYGGQTYTICKDATDPDLAVKVAAVHRAVRLIIDRGIRIPYNLRVYCINIRPAVIFSGACRGCQYAQNKAFIRGINWIPVADITLANLQPLTQRTISVSGFNGLDKPTITMVHEIGHIIHERVAGEYYWTSAMFGKPKRGSAIKLYPGANPETDPLYADGSKKEFVAEAWAASVIGMSVRDPLVWFEYTLYRGPYAKLLSR